MIARCRKATAAIYVKDGNMEHFFIRSIAEILWSADSLGLECDLDYLVSFLENHNQQS